MPSRSPYKAGSIIYFENDPADKIYILKKGAVQLTYINDMGEEVAEMIREGEFFGVKSALARERHDETATIVTDSDILVLDVNEFENIAIKNQRLVMKMLRMFSNQLRRLGKQVSKHLELNESTDPSVELFRIGDYYLKNKKFDNATYAFTKYLEHFPNGELVEKAKERISLAQRGISHGFKPIVVTEDGEIREEATISQARKEKLDIPKPKEKAPAEEPKEEPKKADSGSELSIAKEFYEGVNLVAESDYERALKVFNKIKESGALEEHPDMQEKVEFEIGKCHQALKDFKQAIVSYTNLIKSFPKTENMKNILYNLGKSYQETGEINKAIGFFKKVMNTQPNDDVSKKAKKSYEAIVAQS